MTTLEALQASREVLLDMMSKGKFFYSVMMVGDQRVEIRSHKDAVIALKDLDRLIAEESGTSTGRAYAQNGGRGYVNGYTSSTGCR